MADGTMPKPLHDLASAFLITMVVGGILLGWLNNRGRPRREDGGSTDGSGADDGQSHHGWWGGSDHDVGDHGDGGDGGH